MFHFEGDKEFSRPAQELWEQLRDARFLVQCIPDVERVVRAEHDDAVCVLRPGFSFVRGSLEVTMHIADDIPGCSMQLTLNSKGIGSSSSIQGGVELIPRESGTRVHWTADVVQLGGLLKAVPQGLIRASAQKVISDIWDSIAAKLQRP